MIRAVIFDMDGLLLETEIVSYQIYKELLEEFGYEFTTHEYSEQYSGKTEIINVNNLIDTYELPWSTELGIEKVSLKEKDLLSRGVDLKPGVGKVLSYLKNNNYKIALATSSTQDRAFGVLEEHNILDYFDTEVYSEDVDRSKPNPDIFLQAAKNLNEKPSNCLVIEDSEAGIEASHRANIPVICVPDMKDPSQDSVAKTEAVFSQLGELVDYLENNNK